MPVETHSHLLISFHGKPYTSLVYGSTKASTTSSMSSLDKNSRPIFISGCKNTKQVIYLLQK